MNSLPILYSLLPLMSYEKLSKSSSSSEKVFTTQLLSLKELNLGFQLRMPPVGTLKQECSRQRQQLSNRTLLFKTNLKHAKGMAS